MTIFHSIYTYWACVLMSFLVTPEMANYTAGMSGNNLAEWMRESEDFMLQLMSEWVETGVHSRAPSPGSHAQPLKH